MRYYPFTIRFINDWFLFSDDPEPFISGVRINSPHYLCKIILSEASPRYFTLVVSQYEKMNTIYYSLRAYATCPFLLDKFPNNYSHVQKVRERKNFQSHRCVLPLDHTSTMGSGYLIPYLLLYTKVRNQPVWWQDRTSTRTALLIGCVGCCGLAIIRYDDWRGEVTASFQ